MMGNRKAETPLPEVRLTIRQAQATPARVAAWSRLWRWLLASDYKAPCEEQRDPPEARAEVIADDDQREAEAGPGGSGTDANG
jgi:hypothetical protein